MAYMSGRKILFHFSKFIRNDEGATMMEYGLLVALLSVIALVVIKNLGQSVNTTFEAVDAGLPG